MRVMMEKRDMPSSRDADEGTITTTRREQVTDS
jgi:hypothetical protein